MLCSLDLTVHFYLFSLMTSKVRSTAISKNGAILVPTKKPKKCENCSSVLYQNAIVKKIINKIKYI